MLSLRKFKGVFPIFPLSIHYIFRIFALRVTSIFINYTICIKEQYNNAIYNYYLIFLL